MTCARRLNSTDPHFGRFQTAFRAALEITLGNFKTADTKRVAAVAVILYLSSSAAWCGDTSAAGNATVPLDGKNQAISPQALRGTTWWRVATERGLDPYILYAVALVESPQVNNRLATPWPWAINRQGRTIIPSSRTVARGILNDALTKGIRAIDVGLMQVNVRWHGHRVRSPEELLDPETNIRVGADVLAEAIRSAPGNLTLGIGRYHAGWHNDTDAYRYGQRVLAVAQRIRWLL